MDRQQSNNMDLFLKLGYASGDILRVLESLPHDAPTNDILEELIKTCRRTESSPVPQPPQSSPQLISRGCSPVQSPQPSLSAQEDKRDSPASLRPIVIDGSNVAMSHGNKQVFSCRGVQLAVKWFWDRGHRDITVFVPLWRKEQARPEAPITDQHILLELEKRKILVFTPSRCVNGKRVVCYDDRYIVKLAYDSDGIIVSNDNYRDLQLEKPQWKKFIEERLLMYTFANDKFMPPDDPQGRNGPPIDNFLRINPKLPNKRQHCPYGKKCTYGVKCKFYHPERSHSQLSVADELRAKNKMTSGRDHLAEVRTCSSANRSLPSTAASFPEPGRAYHSYHGHPSTTAPSNQEAPARFSPNERLGCPEETSSPAQFRKSPTCPSPDVDEAFGSMEASMSGLYIQDQGYSTGHSGSSNGCSGNFTEPTWNQDSSSYFTSSAPGGHRHRPCSQNPVHGCCCSHYTWLQGSLEANQDSNSLGVQCQQHSRSYYRAPLSGRDAAFRVEDSCNHQSAHNKQVPPGLGSPIWERSRAVAGGTVTNGSSDSLGELRWSVRTHLSTIFPPQAVDHVMTMYPQTLDMSTLVPLIHTFKSSSMRF
ncbi:hypothetical protein GJAV_G00119070 [Gymnothorax javanicus]|nr:hypothetical protein GJAV_G00119070 [Gymnothorax javanicus]